MTSFITEKGNRTVRHIESAIFNQKKITSSVILHIINKTQKITFSVNLAKFSTPSHRGGFLFLNTQITVKATAPVSTSYLNNSMLFQRKILA